MTGRLVAALAALGAALCIGGIAAPGAAAAEKAIWGPLELPGGGSAFDLYRATGTDTFQLQVRWSDVATARPANPTDPADPAYVWPAAVDRAIAEGRRTGVSIALLVTRTPGWANGGRPPIWAANDPADFGAFLQAAARRYPSVRKWMIWGEPNKSDRFQPAGNEAAGVYARLLDAAYTGVKRASARNIVIGGMTWTGGDVKPAPFLQALKLPNGKRPRLDWYGHNPFPFRPPNLAAIPLPGGWRDISDLDTFEKEIRRAFGRTKPLWLSEFTVLSDRPSNAFQQFVSQEKQAQYLTAAFGIADQIRSVRGLGWLNLTDQPEAPRSSNWGLMTATGARKPAFAAYRDARNAGLRPATAVARRIRRAALRGRGVAVRVRPKRSGRVAIELRDRRGTRVVRLVRSMRASRRTTVRLRRNITLRSGKAELSVRAPGGETARTDLTVLKRR